MNYQQAHLFTLWRGPREGRKAYSDINPRLVAVRRRIEALRESMELKRYLNQLEATQ